MEELLLPRSRRCKGLEWDEGRLGGCCWDCGGEEQEGGEGDGYGPLVRVLSRLMYVVALGVEFRLG